MFGNMEILSSGPPVSFEGYVDFYRKVFGERYAAFFEYPLPGGAEAKRLNR